MRSSITAWFPVLSLALVTACGGSGGDGSSTPGVTTVLTGVVRSPGGASVGLQAGVRRLADVRDGGGRQGIELPGLLPVPDFTDVELVRVDPNGGQLSIVARGSTVAGEYRFNLTDLNLGLSSMLVVRVGNGASRMHALAVRDVTDVDPVSEAVMELLLSDAGPLDRLTLKEVGDFQDAVEWLTMAEDLAAGVDVPATVALLQARVRAQPSLVDYMTLAGGPGQTEVGPGDVTDFFPFALGHTWVLRGTRSLDGGPAEPYGFARRIVGDDSVVFSVARSDPPESRTPIVELATESSLGVFDHGIPGSDDPLQVFAPYLKVRYPVRPGETRELFAGADLPAGDADGDGQEDLLDAVSEATTVGFERVVTPSGTFDQSLRIETTLETFVRFSGGGVGSSFSSVTEWFAPGIGLVRSEGTREVDLGTTMSESFSVELTDHAVGDRLRGALPPLTLIDDVGTGPGGPTQPVASFDGVANHVVVAAREVGPDVNLVASIVSPEGLPLFEVPVATIQDAQRPPEIAVATGGFHLIVWVEGSTNARLRAVRMTRAGQVLEPGVFDLTIGTAVDLEPAVAFNGQRFVVVWRRSLESLGGDEGDLFCRFVAQDGMLSAEFPVHLGPGVQSEPAVAAGGGNQLVVWTDDASGADELHGARIDLEGEVLEPGSFLVSRDEALRPEGGPAVASDGVGFLVAWTRTINVPQRSRLVLALRFDGEGNRIDEEPLEVYTRDLESDGLSMGFDGTNYVLGWRTLSFGDQAGIHLARVSTMGELVDGPPTDARLVVAPPPGVTLAHPALSLAGRGVLVVWGFDPDVGERAVEGSRIFDL